MFVCVNDTATTEIYTLSLHDALRSDAVSRELRCPVLLDNDVNVLALGEQHAGVARSARDFLFVKIGTGIGCGIVVDGRSEEHTSELQSRQYLVCRLLLEKKQTSHRH